jgi:hypothetical protein
MCRVKIQEFLLVIVIARALPEKIQGLPCVSAVYQQKKNRTSLSHLQLILEFFQV